MSASAQSPNGQPRQRSVWLFLCGDVMTGRGIDQVLPHPSDPVLHESYVTSAMDYVQLAEAANGPIPRRVSPAYIWGAALDEFNRLRPVVRIINLETSITRSDDYAPKGINYRMSPENVDCLKAAAIDCCVLGNNHVLDYGRRGLLDTLETLVASPDQDCGRGTQSQGSQRARGTGHCRELSTACIFVRLRDERHSPQLGCDRRGPGR